MRCQERRKTPVFPVGGAAQVVSKKPVDIDRVQHKTLRKFAMRRRVLMRSAAGVKQQLQGQFQARIPRHDRAHGGQRAARAVAADGQALVVQPQTVRVDGQPLQRVPRIVRGGGEFVFGREPVVQRHHGAAHQVAELAAQHIMRGDAANGETAAVQIQQHRQLVVRRCVKPRRQGVAVTRRNGEVFHPAQDGFGDFQHARPRFVGGASLCGRQGVKRRTLSAGHAADDVAHGGRQQAVGGFEMHHLARFSQGLKTCA